MRSLRATPMSGEGAPTARRMPGRPGNESTPVSRGCRAGGSGRSLSTREVKTKSSSGHTPPGSMSRSGMRRPPHECQVRFKVRTFKATDSCFNLRWGEPPARTEQRITCPSLTRRRPSRSNSYRRVCCKFSGGWPLGVACVLYTPPLCLRGEALGDIHSQLAMEGCDCGGRSLSSSPSSPPHRLAHSDRLLCRPIIFSTQSPFVTA